MNREIYGYLQSSGLNLTLNSKKRFLNTSIVQLSNPNLEFLSNDGLFGRFDNKPFVSVNVLVLNSTTNADLAIGLLRLSSVIFDDLKGAGFDNDDTEMDSYWHESHGYSLVEIDDYRNTEGCAGFFWENEPRYGATAAWAQPEILEINFTTRTFDPSFGREIDLPERRFADTLQNWRKLNLSKVDLNAYVNRLESQARDYRR